MDTPTVPESIPQGNAARQPLSPVQERLLALNRQFYATVAVEFDRTRQSLPLGMTTLAAKLGATLAGRPLLQGSKQVSVLDAGCGNGRFARALAQAGVRCAYTGLDADARLLQLAREQTGDLPESAGLPVRFVQADLADPAWAAALGPGARFDAIACLAVLHHFPGLALRRRLVAELAALLKPGGVLALSTWQFLTAERFTAKLADWATIGVEPAEVEAGDALLPWNQGAPALRFVHQLDLPEVEALAAAAGLAVVDSFRADGKEGNLNLYVLLARP